jgi:homoserine kinase
MGRDRTQQATPDLFSTTSSREPLPATKQISSAQDQRHVLPKDLPDAVKHLNDRELDLLIAACLEEAKRRGRTTPSDQTVERASPTGKSSRKGQAEVATVSLTLGQVNAVRQSRLRPDLGGMQPIGLCTGEVTRH